MTNPKNDVTLLHRFAGLLGYLYLHLVGKTSFIHRDDDAQFLEIRRKKTPGLFTFWHNNQVFLAYEHRNEPIHVMVSQSKDGEYIAQVMKWLGVGAVRGSSSKGGGAALRELCSLLKSGKQGGFTPDGPRGPVQTVHGGVIIAARSTGAPVLPMAVYSRRKITFNSWDQFFIPLPFSIIVVHHGKPVWILKEDCAQEAERKIREALNAAQEAAENKGRRAPSWISSFVGNLFLVTYSFVAVFFFPVLIFFAILKFGFKRTFQYSSERFFPPRMTSSGQKRLWLHVASYGEWQGLRPIFSQLKARGCFQFLITTNTPEARHAIAVQEPSLLVHMMPLDMPFVSSSWIKGVSVDALLILEKELWPHLLINVHKRHIPIFILNGRLSETSLKKWTIIQPLIQRLLNQMAQVFVRSLTDQENFLKLGVDAPRLHVTGNTKYDSLTLLTSEDRKRKKQQLPGLRMDDICIVGGSTWPGEEGPLLSLFDKNWSRRCRVILAPRHLKRLGEIKRLLEKFGRSWSLWSDIKKGGNSWDKDVLLVDTIGDLKDLYAAADVAFVGKSLKSGGGQNPMEPAASGIPVVFGPSMENFPEESDSLLKANGAIQIADETDLLETLHRIGEDQERQNTIGYHGQNVIRENQGGSSRIVAFLIEKIGEK